MCMEAIVRSSEFDLVVRELAELICPLRYRDERRDRKYEERCLFWPSTWLDRRGNSFR